nr:uncharacterized protein LOC107456490 isoform X2 [Parasteatoda tepidariorum]
MADNRPTTRKRAEVLFDVLTAKDNNVHCETTAPFSTVDNEQKKISEKNENKTDTAVKEDDQHENVVNENKAPEENKVPSEDALKYKGLLQEIDDQLSIEELCAVLQGENTLAKRCQSALSLAVLCRSQLSEKECKFIFDTLTSLPNHHNFYAFSFCHSLLLYMLTTQNLSPELCTILEANILKVAHSVINQDAILGNGFTEARIILLGGERYMTACKLCEEIFCDDNLDVNALDVSTICCSSLRSMVKLNHISTGRNQFSDDTLKYILSMIGKSTQDIISENLINMEDEDESITIASYTVNQCLQVLEQILSVDPSSPCKTLDHEDFSLLRCLTKLLEWSMISLFPQHVSNRAPFKVKNAVHAFHLSTLVSILKVFSILSFDPDQYDSFTNVKGSMEKIMLVILKTYFQAEDKHFDVLVLALELMINFALKCKKTFVLLCLKKFEINSSEEILAIEALLKILDTSLEKISRVKLRTVENPESNSEVEDQEAPTEQQEVDYLNLVLQAADEDMELSMIVSFTGILLMYFIDTKKSFSEFVQERLSSEKCADVVAVSKKFLQFTLITGGMPATGILLLRTSITKLSELHPSSS